MHEGRPCVYTLGCADPFYLDEPGVRFIPWGDTRDAIRGRPKPMRRPLTPEKELAALDAREASIRRYNATHGWRGPR
jgi:hypothetical protein